jgi:putative addiction module component (TIGR02574 family)
LRIIGYLSEMASRAKSLTEQVLKLPKLERAALIGKVVWSLDEPLRAADRISEQAWEDEIRARLKSVEDRSAKTVSWPALRRQLMRARHAPARG